MGTIGNRYGYADLAEKFREAYAKSEYEGPPRAGNWGK
jgi:hypothetical protein